MISWDVLQHRAAHFVMNKPWYRQRHMHNVSITKILTELHWPTLQNCRKQLSSPHFDKIVNSNLIVPARCLPLSPTLACTCANHSLKYTHLQLNMDILSCPEQLHNGTIYKLQTLTLATFKQQLQTVLNLQSCVISYCLH